MDLLKTTSLCSALALCGCPEQESVETPATQAEADVTQPDPNNQSWRCTDDCVTLTGTLNYSGQHEGMPQLDFMVIEGGDAPPQRKHAMPINRLGDGNTWEVMAPVSEVQGIELTVVGFIDLEQNGPTDGDPAGFSQLVVNFEVTEGEEPTFGSFDIEVMDEPNICDFPGGNFGAATCGESNANNPFQNADGEEGSTEEIQEPVVDNDTEASQDEETLSTGDATAIDEVTLEPTADDAPTQEPDGQ